MKFRGKNWGQNHWKNQLNKHIKPKKRGGGSKKETLMTKNREAIGKTMDFFRKHIGKQTSEWKSTRMIMVGDKETKFELKLKVLKCIILPNASLYLRVVHTPVPLPSTSAVLQTSVYACMLLCLCSLHIQRAHTQRESTSLWASLP